MMLLHTLFVLTTALSPAMAPQSVTEASVTRGKAANVILTCKSEALIRGADVLMRDLAAIDTPDPVLTARIGEIRIGNRPAMGTNRVFPRGDLRSRLVVAGLSPTQIKMVGANEVVAQPLGTTVETSDIREITDPVLQATIQLGNHDIEFELTSRLRSMRVPPGRYDLSFRAKLREGRLGMSTATIDLEVVVDGDVFKKVPVVYRLRRFVRALRSTRVIKKGEAFGTHNLTLERLEAAPGSNMHLTSFEITSGMVAARNVQNNRNLSLGDLTKPAVIHRNDLVTLVTKRGRIQVTAKAVALEDGAVGSRIKVRNLSSNRPVQAVVRSQGLVVLP